MSKNLTSESRFKILHQKVTKGLVEVGQALEEIRDKKLYLAGGHKTFKDYCASIERDYHWAWRQIEASKIAVNLPEVKNVSTALEVRKIKIPERRKEAVSSALKQSGGKLSAPAVKSAGKVDLRPKFQPLDGTKLPIPPEIQEFWNRNEETQHLIAGIKKARLALENGEKDLLFGFVDRQGTISRLKMAEHELQCGISFAVCPHCNGVLFKNCSECKGRGSLPEFYWDLVPEEIKKLREK